MSPYANAFVQKAAGLYGLKSGQQGSGRKRFVIVAVTKHTRLPEAAERERLAHMLASNDNAAAALRPLSTKPCTSGKGAHLLLTPFVQGFCGVSVCWKPDNDFASRASPSS